MLVLRNTSLVACLLILFFSAALITEAQTEATSTATTTASSSEATATSTPPARPAPVSRAPQTDRPISGYAEQTRQQLETRVQDRITKLAANVSNRLDATILRFKNIADRLDSRMEKLRRSGVDTAAAEQALGNTRRLVGAAEATMSDIDQLVYDAVTSEAPREAWPAVKGTLRDARADLIRAHESFREVVRLLKEAIGIFEGPEGSSSATVINASSF